MTAHDPLFWLSFVREGQFAGACIVRAADGREALQRAAMLKIHPGGHVALTLIEPSQCDPEIYERATALEGQLMTSQTEMEALFGPARTDLETGIEHVCEDCSHVHSRLN